MKIRGQNDFSSLTDSLARILYLALCYGFLLLVFFFPFVPFAQNPVSAKMFLIPLFYWQLFRPAVMPFAVIIVFGFLTDILYGYSYGLYTLLFCLIFVFLRFYRGRLSTQSFPVLWLLFSLMLGFVSGVELIYSQIVMQGFFPFGAVMSDAGLTALAFPFMTVLLFYQNKLFDR